MQALAAPLDKAPDAIRVVQRLDELQFAVRKTKERDLDALVLDQRAAVDAEPKAVAIKGNPRVEFSHGNRHVMNAPALGHRAMIAPKGGN
jgi:hypothetical protein